MKRGLGRGLDALFSIYDEDDEIVTESNREQSAPEVKKENNGSPNNILEIDIRKITPNENQPRKKFDAESIRELAESIKLHGVIQPIIVNDEGDEKYSIIAGERRFRASIVAGKTSIPAIIKHYSQKEVKEVSLIENLQREDLNPIEAARAIRELMNEYSFTQETVAERISKSRPLVANTLRLLTLAPEVISLIETNKLSAGHGKCLVSIEDKNRQIELARFAVENKLTVRDLEKLSQKAHLPVAKQNNIKVIQSIELKELTHRMQRLFNTKVAIKGNDKKGKISIDYYTQDDLDRICAFISQLERK